MLFRYCYGSQIPHLAGCIQSRFVGYPSARVLANGEAECLCYATMSRHTTSIPPGKNFSCIAVETQVILDGGDYEIL